MNLIYHLTTVSAWADALEVGSYRTASLATEGFIHASTAEQVAASANRFFEGQPAILLLEIDLDRVEPPVIWESSPHSPHPFPHLYGPLNTDAVVGRTHWHRSDDGSFHFPP